MQKEKSKRITAVLLGLLLTASAQTPQAFAAGETNVPAETGVTSEQSAENEDPAPATAPVLTQGEEGGGQGGGQSGTDTPTEPTDPDTPDEPAVVHKLEGKVYTYPYNSSVSAATAASGKKITVTLGNGSTKTVTSSSDGSISLELSEEEVATSGTYSWSFDKDDDCLSTAGAIKEGSEEKLYIRERYEPVTSDYRFAESDDIIDEILRIAGVYTIVPAEGKKLATSLDGEAKDSIKVTVSPDGKVSDFYVYIGDNCSKPMSNDTVVIDDGAPKIGEVSTSAAKPSTYVKAHGIYSKEKADILVNAKITEKGVGLDKVYLVSTKDDKTTTYEPISSKDISGEYTYSIALPEEETLMDAQLVKLVAVDRFGNKSAETLIAQTEDGSSVTIEAIAPALDVSLSSKPNAHGWYNSLPSLTAKASDNLSGLASMSISEDGEELESLTLEEKVKSERSISAKAKIDEPSEDGKYTFKTVATDNSGNEITKENVLKIDLVAPKIEASGVKTGEHYRSVPAIKVTEDEKYYDADGASISYVIRRDGEVVARNTVGKVDKLTLPSSAFSKDGVYSVEIDARDAAGNESNELSYEFTKDSTAPVVAWSGIKNGKFYNKKQTAKLTVKERFYKTNNVNVSAVRKLGGATSNEGFPWKNSGETSVSSKTFSATGTYTLTASATDKAGNSSGQKTLTFTIDTKAPEISITGVKDGGIYTYGMGLAPNAKVTDDYPDKQSISYTKAGVPISNPSFAQYKENDGLYTMTVTATDKAGNTTTKTISFVVNRFGSYFEYNDEIQKVMGNAWQNIDKDLVITEKNVSEVTESELKVFRDGKAVESTAKTSPADKENGYNVYRHVFGADNFKEEGAYEINVISKDSVGNEMESKDETGKVVFYVDRTAPTLTVDGIDPKGIKAEQAQLTVNSSDLLTGVKDITATVNGSPVVLKDNGNGTWGLTLNEGLRQPVHIIATDGAGNEATFDEEVSVSSSGFSLFFDRFKHWLGIGAAALIAVGGGLFFLAKRREDDDDEEEEEEASSEE